MIAHMDAMLAHDGMLRSCNDDRRSVPGRLLCASHISDGEQGLACTTAYSIQSYLILNISVNMLCHALVP